MVRILTSAMRRQSVGATVLKIGAALVFGALPLAAYAQQDALEADGVIWVETDVIAPSRQGSVTPYLTRLTFVDGRATAGFETFSHTMFPPDCTDGHDCVDAVVSLDYIQGSYNLIDGVLKVADVETSPFIFDRHTLSPLVEATILPLFDNDGSLTVRQGRLRIDDRVFVPLSRDTIDGVMGLAETLGLSVNRNATCLIAAADLVENGDAPPELAGVWKMATAYRRFALEQHDLTKYVMILNEDVKDEDAERYSEISEERILIWDYSDAIADGIAPADYDVDEQRFSDLENADWEERKATFEEMRPAIEAGASLMENLREIERAGGTVLSEYCEKPTG